MARFEFIKQVIKEFGQDKVGQLSAAFSYGAIFSLGPLLLVMISIVGFVYGTEATQGKLYADLSSTVGGSAAKTIQDVIAHTRQSNSGILALLIGVIGMLLGASGISSQLQNSFNAIFGVVPDPKGGIKRTIYVKVKNVLLVIVGGIVVAASLVASSLVIGLGARIRQQVDFPAFGLEVLNNVISLSVFVLILYLLYRTLPDILVPRKIVLAAAFVISILFIVGKVVLGIIIGRNGATSAYGAAAALVSLLLWIYYSAQILFIGAEGMKVYGDQHAIAYQPKKFNLKRTTIHIDGDGLQGSLVRAWTRGFRKGASKK